MINGQFFFPQKKYGYCRICTEDKKLTVDHIPPQSCYNKDHYFTTTVHPSYRGKKDNSTRSRKALKFKTICTECNNLLGKFDKDLSILCKYLHQFFKSRNYIFLREQYTLEDEDINYHNVIKSLLGHILAFSDLEMMKNQPNYNNKCKYPKMYNLVVYNDISICEEYFFILFPYNGNTKIIKGFGVIPSAEPSTGFSINSLCFYPLAFFLVEKEQYNHPLFPKFPKFDWIRDEKQFTWIFNKYFINTHFPFDSERYMDIFPIGIQPYLIAKSNNPHIVDNHVFYYK